MSIDLEKSARRWRAALTAAAFALAAVVAGALARAARPEWRQVQERAGAAPGIVQLTTCEGEVDRCLTCHPRAALAGGHSPPLGRHRPEVMGCGACHGGAPRALAARAAHAAPGTDRPDPRLEGAHLQASCAKCHVPGDRPGMEHLTRGAGLFTELGCAVCHPLSGGGLGGGDFGPDLRAAGRKSPAALELALFEPTRRQPGSTMPSFAHAFAADRASLEDLLVFLESLPLPLAEAGVCSVRAKSASMVGLPCATCHAGAGGKASGRLRHRCLYIQSRKESLACGSCHAQGVPSGGAAAGACPFIEEQRGACAACHGQGAEP